MNSGLCKSCQKQWGGCNMCTKDGCSLCNPDGDIFYLDRGSCKKCSDLYAGGCSPGFCKPDGCKQCLSGFYLNGKSCVKCKNSLGACDECTNAKTCTKCSNPLLTVNPTTQKCECAGGRANMIKADDGSCACASGYWMTESGC